MKQTFIFSGHHENRVEMLGDIVRHISGKLTSRVANCIKANCHSKVLVKTVVTVSAL